MPKQDPTQTALRDYTADDQLLFDSMAKTAAEEEDDYYNRMKNLDSIFGTGLDLFGQQMDYQAFAMEANRRAAAARDRKKRGEAIIAKAGEGAEERIEAARGAKMAAAQSTLQRAADKAAMDTTGTAAIELAQRAPDTIKAAGDAGVEETREMERALREQELGLQETYAAKQDELAATTARDARRLQRIKEGVFSVGKLAASFAPKDFERAQADKARRGQKKFQKQGQKAIDLSYEAAQATAAGDDALATRLEGRRDRAMKRAERGFEKRETALDTLRKSQAEKLAKQRALYGGTMASSFQLPTSETLPS